jgi:hypothetical protein
LFHVIEVVIFALQDMDTSHAPCKLRHLQDLLSSSEQAPHLEAGSIAALVQLLQHPGDAPPIEVLHAAAAVLPDQI